MGCYDYVKSEEEYDEILANKEYVFVIYSATWCGPCKTFKNWLEEEYTTYPYPHPILVVDIEEWDDIANKENISGLPTMIVFHNKNIVERTEGFHQKELKKIFDHYHLLPSYEVDIIETNE